MTITLKYFGLLTDVTQKREEIFTVGDRLLTLSFLKTELETTYDGFDKAQYSIAVNQKLSNLDYTIKDQDIIAFLPPFAGG